MQYKKFLYIAISVLWLLISYLIILFCNNETIILFASEDGFYETASAIYFFLASIFFFYLYIKNKQGNDLYIFKTNKNIFFLLLGILFLFGAGEEISWGQRLFNIQTPEELKEINIQNELNIHNLKIFHGDNEDGVGKTGLNAMITSGRLLNIFWFTYCFLIPILNRKSRIINKIIKRINLPIGPIWIGILFIANYIILKITSLFISDNMIHYITEIKESNYAFLFFMVGVYFFRTYHQNKTK